MDKVFWWRLLIVFVGLEYSRVLVALSEDIVKWDY